MVGRSSDNTESISGSIGTYINDSVICYQDMGASSVANCVPFAFVNRLSHWLLVVSSVCFFLSESQQFMTESHTVLDRLDPPSTQEISTLDHSNLDKTGTGGRHTSILMPIPETALQYLPSSTITEIHTSDHDLEKSGTSDSEKALISIPVPGLETETLDIEHVPVENDPRKWSSFRKVSFLPVT